MQKIAFWVWLERLLCLLVWSAVLALPSCSSSKEAETVGEIQQSVSTCGDGTCVPNESPSSCPADCRCGDFACSQGESYADCPSDCKCGDGFCNFGETPNSCTQDCTCGNGLCDGKENYGNCPTDCKCGDGVCSGGETTATCAGDCPPPEPTRPTPLTSTGNTGTLTGSSNVNRLGAYNYDIPLPVPMGRAGMAPELSLHYASNAGEGLVGVGWAVSATSQIRRCREVWARSQMTERIDFDQMSFCLDGEPLVVVSRSGVAAEYRTLLDKYAKILSDGGPSLNKPARFVVYQRDGRILEYGVSADSRPA